MKRKLMFAIFLPLLLPACIVQTRGTRIRVAEEGKQLRALTQDRLLRRYGMPERQEGAPAAGPGYAPAAGPSDARGAPPGMAGGTDTGQPVHRRFLRYEYSKTYLIVLYYWYKKTRYTFVLEGNRVVDLFEHDAEKASGLTLFGIMPIVNVAGPAAGGPGGGP